MPHYGALASDVARLAVARQLQEFGCDPEELAWLVREAPLRYPAWPGIREIRALYCGRFSPRDGVVVALPGLRGRDHSGCCGSTSPDR